jgi:SAM-dependent methyltransferase
VFISISDSGISAAIKEKCLSAGYAKIYLISEIDFRLELLEMGYKKASSDIKYEVDCPICGADSFQYFINMVDYELVKCCECEHIYVKNMDDINPICFYDDNIDYYRNIFYDGLENFDSSNFAKPDSYISNRLELINGLLDTEIEKHSDARFLEIGCLDGRLLFYLKKLGLKVYGCEVNKPVAEYAAKILDIDIRTQELSDCVFEDEYFDYVFSSHVLEHLKDPVGEMALIAKLMRINGKSIHHLPCGEDDYENTHHLHFFSEKSIIKLHTRFFGNASHFTTQAQRGDGSVYDVITVMSTKAN